VKIQLFEKSERKLGKPIYWLNDKNYPEWVILSDKKCFSSGLEKIHLF